MSTLPATRQAELTTMISSIGVDCGAVISPAELPEKTRKCVAYAAAQSPQGLGAN